MTENKAMAATPHTELIAELMNPNNPKNEREHAAVREIERLREDQQGVDAVDTLTEEGWLWDGDQWQRPALQSAWLLESTQTLAKPVLQDIEQYRMQMAGICTAPPQQQAEPVAYYHPRNGFYWAKPTSIFAPTVVDVPPIPLYTTAAQREWQSLTDEDWEKVSNKKNTVLDTFEQGATWAAYKLERLNK